MNKANLGTEKLGDLQAQVKSYLATREMAPALIVMLMDAIPIGNPRYEVRIQLFYGLFLQRVGEVLLLTQDESILKLNLAELRLVLGGIAEMLNHEERLEKEGIDIQDYESYHLSIVMPDGDTQHYGPVEGINYARIIAKDILDQFYPGEGIYIQYSDESGQKTLYSRKSGHVLCRFTAV